MYPSMNLDRPSPDLNVVWRYVVDVRMHLAAKTGAHWIVGIASFTPWQLGLYIQHHKMQKVLSLDMRHLPDSSKLAETLIMDYAQWESGGSDGSITRA